MRSIIRAVVALSLMIGVMHTAQRVWLEFMIEGVKRAAATPQDQVVSKRAESKIRYLTREEADAMTGIYTGHASVKWRAGH